MMCRPMTAKPAGRHTTVALAPPAVGQIAEALEAFCQAEALPEDAAWRLKLAMDEIVANVVSHGATGRPGGRIDVWFCRDHDMVEVRVEDDGLPFDPLSRPDPDVSGPLEERQPGGLGIVLVKGLLDEVRYQRTTRNILTLRKGLDAGGNTGAAGKP
jgi:serine/threonine-protein kinase RsbW